MAAATLAQLREIQRRDPNGGYDEPTIDDILNFENWVKTMYGTNVLEQYYKGNWEPGPDV